LLYGHNNHTHVLGTLMQIGQFHLLQEIHFQILSPRKAKKYNVVVRSHATTKYRAIVSTFCKLIWLKLLKISHQQRIRSNY